MDKITPLHHWHQEHNAHIGPFAGYSMPLHYGSALGEHQAVRSHVGMFDISHMRFAQITGASAKKQLEILFANDIEKCVQPGKACYSCMLTEAGGTIDDMIIYKMSEQHYNIVLNASCAEKDLRWITSHTENLEVQDFPDKTMIALQGPSAVSLFASLFPEYAAVENLTAMTGHSFDDAFIARSGYTGEDGLEIVCSKEKGVIIFDTLYNNNVTPCGLVSRDSLRLEAGLNLYGLDMDETIMPIECGLSWTVDFTRDRPFIGRQALLTASPETLRTQVGFTLPKKTIARHGARIVEGGVVTSGGYAPSLEKAIGFALIPKLQQSLIELSIEVRGKPEIATRTSTRFYKRVN